MTRFLLTLLALLTITASAHAQLGGMDTKPGDSCSASEEGYVRRNASADRDISEITLICDGSQWQSATGGTGLAVLQGQEDPGPCSPEKHGVIRFDSNDDPPWQYCDGGLTTWLPFRFPQCQDDDAGDCMLAASRIANDPQFKPSSIRCGDKLLGVTGTYGSGSSNAFDFVDITDVAFNTLITAPAVTISGIPAGCPGEVFVSGQGSPQISINGGGWSSWGSITNGQTLAVRLTSGAAFGTTHTALISISSTDESWSVTTIEADTTPNSFSFTDQTNVALSTLTTSNTITISGINTTTPVSVTGTSAQVSINGGAWTTSGNITNGQTLAVRLTLSSSNSTARTATVNVGGVTDVWSVTTKAACGGTLVGGYCWYAAASTNQSCDTACSARGGCNLAGTRDYAGSAGSNANCMAVLTALGFSGASIQVASTASGCYYNPSASNPKTRRGSTATTCAYKESAHRRMCACNN